MSTLLVLGISFLIANAFAQTSVDKDHRINCYPEKNAPTEEYCRTRHCVWDNGTDYDYWEDVPKCYYPQTTGYLFDSKPGDNEWIVKKVVDNATNPGCSYGKDFEKLRITARYLDSQPASMLNIRIEPVDAPSQRYEPDIWLQQPEGSSLRLLNLEASEDTAEKFAFSVIRAETLVPIWDTKLGGLMFADQFIQIATLLPTPNVYGFGENGHQALKHSFSKYSTWAMFGRDDVTSTTPVLEDPRNLNGVHPFYMAIEEDGKAHGVFFLNSNAQEVTTGPAPHLIYRTIGGILDIYFFPGPTPADVIKQYWSLIGKPFLPPVWALGFQVSMGDDEDFDSFTNNTLNPMLEEKIPFDVVHIGHRYMDKYQDFLLSDSSDWENFNVTQLCGADRKVIYSVDPAIDVTSEIFLDAKQKNVSFIKYPETVETSGIESQYNSTNNTKLMLAISFPYHHVAFPDFFEANAVDWWKSNIQSFFKKLPFDGIWLSENEPRTYEELPGDFYEDDTDNGTLLEPLSCDNFLEPDSLYDNAPYGTIATFIPGDHEPLSARTLCMLARTKGGEEVFYNNKNLYGLYESKPTYEALQELDERKLLISRSTFPGLGRYAGHSFDNTLSYYFGMKVSTFRLQEFNLFGIPYSGADICGAVDEDEQLALLRYRLGAFFPLSKNCPDPQGPLPVQLPSLLEAAREALSFRYSYISYLYSLHFAAAKDGELVIRPPFFEFPNDNKTYNLGGIETLHQPSPQFMWGDSMMLVPPTEDPQWSKIDCYLPTASSWYFLNHYLDSSQTDLHGTKLNKSDNCNNYISIDKMFPVFQRGGRIIPRQYPELTVTATRKNPLKILIATEDGGAGKLWANGKLYWDDGITVIKDFLTHKYCELEFNFTADPYFGLLTIEQKSPTCADVKLPKFGNLEIFGYPYPPERREVIINNLPSPNTTVKYDSDRKNLKVYATVDLHADSSKIGWKNHAEPSPSLPTTTTTTSTTPTTTTGSASSPTSPLPASNRTTGSASSPTSPLPASNRTTGSVSSPTSPLPASNRTTGSVSSPTSPLPASNTARQSPTAASSSAGVTTATTASFSSTPTTMGTPIIIPMSTTTGSSSVRNVGWKFCIGFMLLHFLCSSFRLRLI